MREAIKKRVPKSLIELYKKGRYYTIVVLFYIFRLCPLNQRKVAFMNVWGFGDNTKYIAEELAKHKKNVKIIYITNQLYKANPPEGIQVLKTNSVAAIYALATSKVWVETNRKEAYIRKRKGQYYIQTWHGGLPLKKIEGDCTEFLGEDYIRRAKWDSAMTNLYVSNGRFCTDLYRRAFWYDGKILECGMPRNDMLFSKSEERMMKTRRFMGIKDGVSIAIYAPTYRESGSTQSYITDIEKLRAVLCETTGKDFVVIIRLHPLCAYDNRIYQYNEHIINGNKSRDMYELMEAADVLITDYSNTMFEFAMMQKPVFLYAQDIEKYEKERGLYFKESELPFSVARKEDELWKHIKEFELSKYLADAKQFIDKTGIVETGIASYKVARQIEKVLKI